MRNAAAATHECRRQEGIHGWSDAGKCIGRPCSDIDLAPKFYPVLSSLQRFLVAVVGLVAAGCGAKLTCH
ncbi:hypothetical protein ELH82_32630 (plasmid) [Rhizobium leguminosarum]|nr:hypothetical protein ELH82_32630 [Rhizobium leguminosarum]